MEMGTRACCATSCIGTHSLFQKLKLEQRQLCDTFHAADVPSRHLLRGFPVENPAVRSEIEEGELRGMKRRLVRSRGSYHLHMLVIIKHRNLILRERDCLFLHPKRSLINPDRHFLLRQAPFSIEFPVLVAKKAMLIQPPDIPGGKQNATEHRFGVHCAGRASQDGGGAMTAILSLFMCEVSLHVVIIHPLLVNSSHLFPGACSCEFRVRHFSDGIEVRLDIILPCLPLLDLLFSHAQSCIDVHCLIAAKLPTPITDNHRWRTKG